MIYSIFLLPGYLKPQLLWLFKDKLIFLTEFPSAPKGTKMSYPMQKCLATHSFHMLLSARQELVTVLCMSISCPLL